MEIIGTATVSISMAVIAIFLVQAIKQAIPKSWHRYIPIPIMVVLVGVGVLLAYLTQGDMVQGGIEGMFAAALAVYGWEFFKMVRGSVQNDA